VWKIATTEGRTGKATTGGTCVELERRV